MSALTMTDLFCGAGGSSTGAVAVPGVSVRLAANHWDKAIETHNTNHPDVDHIQADISQTEPRYVPGTDLLWASPECTNHSRARGRKAASQPDLFGEVLPDAAAERSRATMWDVVRFTEEHNYRAVIVENVVEVADWASPTGIRGGLFHAWLTAMHSMGYKHRIISLNSMHASAMGAPAPQSRDRVYIAFWRTADRAPDFERMQRPRAWCPRCEVVVDAMQWWKRGNGQTRPGRYRAQYLYRCPNVACRNEVVEPFWLPASSIIDWTNPGTRIGDRVKPLAEKTMRRIQAGIERYWAPLLVPVEGRDGKQARPAAEALRTQTSRNETGIALPPFLVERQFDYRTRDLAQPIPTVDVNNVSFRMLEPGEIKAAMAFPAEYVMVGNRREQVKLAGNAVTPPAARDLITAVCEAITGEAVAA